MQDQLQRMIPLPVMAFGILFFTINPAYAYDLGPVEFHGFGSVGYIQSSENNLVEDSRDGTFEFNEFGVSAATTLFDDIYVGMQLMSLDYGAVGNNNVYVNWALADYQWRDALGFKAGKVKLPLGLYNDIRDYDFLRTPIFLPQALYNENYRELMDSYTGGGLYGTFDLGKGGYLGYDLYYGTERDIDEDGGIARDVTQRNFIFIESTVDYNLGGRLKYHPPVQGLLLALSYNQIETESTSSSTTMPMDMTVYMPSMKTYIFSAEYSLGNFTVVGEYEIIDGKIERTIDMSAAGRPVVHAESDINAERYYGLLSYRFTDWFTAGMYYSVDVPDTEDRDGEKRVERGLADYSAWSKDLAVTARFDITDFWLLKLEYHYVDGVSLLMPIDNPDGFAKSWDYFAVKTTFSF